MITTEQDLAALTNWLHSIKATESISCYQPVTTINGWLIRRQTARTYAIEARHKDWDNEGGRTFSIAPWLAENLASLSPYDAPPTCKIPNGAKWHKVDGTWTLYCGKHVVRMPRNKEELEDIERIVELFLCAIAAYRERLKP